MRLADLDYVLPPELIAQEPAPERTAARLLVVSRATGGLRHARVGELPAELRPGDLLVLNDTRVIPARVHGRRPTGGRLEVLLVRPLADAGPPEWAAIARGAPRAGEQVHFPGGDGEWLGALGEGRWRLRLRLDEPVLAWLERVGEVPLPPYIRRPDGPTAADRVRYQTTYARTPGAVAAPTAGLHLTAPLLDALARAGVEVVPLTLHVGPGTFLPIRVDTLEHHTMEAEPYHVPGPTAAALARARAAGRRVVAVGTTTVRALESAADADGSVAAGPGEASLFIRPGHRFRVVDALLTNFHLPRSTLLALVAAFAGWPRVREAYAEAVRLRYRFYSFGDAMLLT
jgi:S-adenosylmethionine:tRNA ribosyltransferase-isomerase